MGVHLDAPGNSALPIGETNSEPTLWGFVITVDVDVNDGLIRAEWRWRIGDERERVVGAILVDSVQAFERRVALDGEPRASEPTCEHSSLRRRARDGIGRRHHSCAVVDHHRESAVTRSHHQAGDGERDQQLDQRQASATNHCDLTGATGRYIRVPIA